MPSAARWLTLAGVCVALLAGAGYVVQRQHAAVLRAEAALVHDRVAELARLRADNERLRAAQPAEAELERLRGDRAALTRLRNEIAGLKQRAEQFDRVVHAPSSVAERREEVRAPARPPKLSLHLGVTPEGRLSLDGQALDHHALKTRFAALSAGDSVEIELGMSERPSATSLTEIKRHMEGIADIAKELGLTLTMQLQPANFNVISRSPAGVKP